MNDNILINIRTDQETDGEKLDAVELQTTGKYGILNKKHYIKYEESQMTGFPDTTTTIKVWDNNVLVSRKGRFNMELHYEVGQQKLCMYPTPYGELAVLIKTQAIEYNFSDNCGALKVDYLIDPDNETVIKNSLNVSIKNIDNQKG